MWMWFDRKIASLNIYYVLNNCRRYADFLSRLNDDRNIRALFERALSSLPPEESMEVQHLSSILALDLIILIGIIIHIFLIICYYFVIQEKSTTKLRWEGWCGMKRVGDGLVDCIFLFLPRKVWDALLMLDSYSSQLGSR